MVTRRSAFYAAGASWAEYWAEVSRGDRKRRLMRKGAKSRRGALRASLRRLTSEGSES